MKKLLCLAPLMLAGCTVGPNYAEPKMPTPPTYAETQGSEPTPDLQGWWHDWHDAELDRLIAMGLAGNPDVQSAIARIRESRAQITVARSAYFPQVNASGGTNYEKFSKNAGLSSLASLLGGGASAGGGSAGNANGIALPGDSITVYSAGFDASWELDVFGGTRRAVQGARARAEAAVWSARDAQLSLIAEIVDAYLQLRTLQARETIARAEVDRQTKRLAILEHTAQSGLTPQGDFIRQRAGLAQALAAVSPIVAEGKAQMHGLAILVGATPDTLIAELTTTSPPLPAPPVVPAGLPSQMLRRRPDVRMAERQLAAATADVGVAVADLYPRFTLTGGAQLISTALGNLFTGDSLQLTGAAQAMFPVLDWGKRKATVRQRKAQAQEAYYAYQKTVLGALRDVEDALIRIRSEQERNLALQGGLADATRAVQVVQSRQASGLVDYSAVLDAQQQEITTRDSLIQSDGALRRDMLALTKALGGGWEGLPPPANP
jgi:NodT family efflux transporter outer membrane factor (OMF) lipoprotein